MSDQESALLSGEVPVEEYLKLSRTDAVHSGIKAGLSTVPLIGGIAAEFFDTVLSTPAKRRYDRLLIEIVETLRRLQNERQCCHFEDLAQNETFISTTLEALQIAMRNHHDDKRRALLNAVVNSALPQAPDDSRQKIFLRWLDELTVWHLRILKLFQTKRIPSIELGDKDWEMNIALDQLGDVIEGAYPELKGQFVLYAQVIHDLYSFRLISNLIPEKGLMSRIEHSPVLTSLAEEFLRYIETPS